MRPEIELVFFTALLSAVLAYAWWIRFRVWMLRQDLFLLRDRLWDVMRAEGRLDDPEHRRARDAINALIRFAPFLSVWTVVRVIIEGPELENEPPPCEDGPITDALNAVVARTSRYLLFQTLSGWAMRAVMALMSFRVHLPRTLARQRFDGFISRAIGSEQMRGVSSLLAGTHYCTNATI